MSELAVFTADHVSRLTGLSPRQVRYWDRTGFFSPTYLNEYRRRAFGRIMKVASRIAVGALFLTILPASSSAQWLSLGLRGTGSVPTGDFAESESSSNEFLISGAKNGFGYGLEAGAGMGPIGAYAGFDHIKFDCAVTTCFDEGKYTLHGVSFGLKLSSRAYSILHPFIKGGVTFNNLRGSYGSSSGGLTADRAPGYEVGAGVELKLRGLMSLSPQLRYVGQNLKARVPGVTSPDPDGQGVNYLTFDVGLSFHSPYQLFGAHRAR